MNLQAEERPSSASSVEEAPAQLMVDGGEPCALGSKCQKPVNVTIEWVSTSLLQYPPHSSITYSNPPISR